VCVCVCARARPAYLPTCKPARACACVRAHLCARVNFVCVRVDVDRARACAPADIFTVRAHALIDGQSSGAGHPRYGGARYEVVNRDTAVTIARAAATDGAEAMVFISAATAPPGVDKRCVDHNALPVSFDRRWIQSEGPMG
jgi:hypothetical protein